MTVVVVRAYALELGALPYQPEQWGHTVVEDAALFPIGSHVVIRGSHAVLLVVYRRIDPDGET